ncbi:hypothetical protein [Maricaulis sp.]|uniref:hypothetical protein n=1 Tax=Maricaulis sp. TaxID=1486257 RepID=UPI002B274EC9|nr:hypothetical protein [Maricaulis sp.]
MSSKAPSIRRARAARLVILPYESHGYRGRESTDWRDRWVKPVEDPMGGGEEGGAGE